MDRQRQSIEIGRLALRVEGEFWNAYYALPDTMEHAELLGSVKMEFVIGRKGREAKAAFVELMKTCVADLLEKAVGARPEWPNPPKDAPEHERSRGEREN